MYLRLYFISNGELNMHFLYAGKFQKVSKLPKLKVLVKFFSFVFAPVGRLYKPADRALNVKRL